MTAWLLTWLWQGTALALAMTVLLRCAPRTNATTKHAIWCGVLLAFVWLGLAASPNLNWGLTPVPVRGSDPIGTAFAEPALYVPSAPESFVTIAIGIWAAIALVNLVRLIPALHAMYAVRDRCRAFPADLEARLPLWRESKDRGRRSQLMTCDAVEGATLVGLHNPCIAIPSSLMNALSADELDQVILHEYAHVQRRDDWVRLAQSLLLSALWIHPAAVLVSRAIDREREMACDEWVIARTGLPKAYARCLAHAAELRANLHSSPALLSAFVRHRHELGRRVEHVLAFKGQTRRWLSYPVAVAAAAAIAGVSVSMQGARFAEIGTLALPHVPSPTVEHVMTSIFEPPMTVAARRKPRTTYAAPEPSTTAATVEMASLESPSVHLTSAVLESRAFEAPLDASVSFAPLAPIPPSAPDGRTAPTDWSSLATPGIEIASVAKKTSVGIANVFGRAGVSLARSF